jgi:peptidyl-prolyl cis-trans isomerase A (cyclophilin A)
VNSPQHRPHRTSIAAPLTALALATVALAACAVACQSTPPEPESRRAPAEATPTEKSPAAAATSKATSTKPRPTVSVSPDDPIKGQFTLEDATKDLPGDGPLVADIKTSLGKLSCELYADKAPITVANFVGLARGLRPWKAPDGTWVKKAGYDGTTFHRIIKGFMIQGGDPQGTGAGEPGYVIPDEIWPGAAHDQRGLLCMANRGPNTNGMQFFITDKAARHLDGGYTIFGKCGPDEVIEKIASAEVRGDRAVNPPKIEQVTVRRGPSASKGTAK